MRAVLLGALLGLVFAASSVYLALRAGLTVSASIPIAVLSISVLKRLGGSTILENNIVQTIGSAGESVAAGVVFTIPALIFLAPEGPGVLQLLPDHDDRAGGRRPGRADDGAAPPRADRQGARRAPLSRGHGVRGSADGRGARRAAGGAGVLGARDRRAVEVALVGLQPVPHRTSAYATPRTSQFPNATIDVDVSPEYLGVGYVIGPRIAGEMFAGGVLSWLVLLPLLSILGAHHDDAVPAHPSVLSQQPRHRPAVPDFRDDAPTSCGAPTSATSAPAPCWRPD